MHDLIFVTENTRGAREDRETKGTPLEAFAVDLADAFPAATSDRVSWQVCRVSNETGREPR